jgi:predicted small secreted protein
VKKLVSLAVLSLSLALTACGNTDPAAGDDCTPENSAVCDGTAAALFCEGGQLRAVKCSGPGGCTSSASTVSCDFSRAQPGDACPRQNESHAQCFAGNADQGLICRSGVWTVAACKGCAVQGGSVVCQP